MYGECYDPEQPPTSGIDADPSITRIKFKQYREWILQNASKADARRLNLEYIDIIIDYILSSLQQPRVSDDAFDIGALQIEKERVMKVGFNPAETIIPEGSIFEVSGETSYDDVPALSGSGGLVEEKVEEGRVGGKEEVLEHEEEEEEEDEEFSFSIGSLTRAVDGTPPLARKKEAGFVEGAANLIDSEDVWAAGVENSTTLTSIGSNAATRTQHDSSSSSGGLGTSTSLQSSSSCAVESSSDEVRSKPTLDGSDMHTTTTQPAASVRASLEATQPGHSAMGRRSSTTDPNAPRQEPAQDEPVFRTRGELSRLLLENIPREILKRMVIRWPVGDEQVVSRAELNKERLMITVWDVSGDPLQQNFTPFFFSHRCLFVATYNLTRGLNSPCQSYASRNLRDPDDHIPTNAEVLEGWLGCATAFSKSTPSLPFHCTKNTPVLPPLILACPFADKDEVRENPIVVHQFFNRESFGSYRKHLVEGNSPTALIISSPFENDGQEGYSGHHLLRREIDHLARQMPFCGDHVPIQWVKFEHLINGLREQKKVVLLYDALARYISEHCKVSGTLQILPILSHFHDVGVISYFYRHPLLSNIVITKPQWLADALGSVITSSPSKWITTEAQAAFARLNEEGVISKENLLMAYRCGRMHQRYWNDTLFILNCMDLACCHPSVHEANALYIPCLVTQSVSRVTGSPKEEEAATLHFSSGSAALPIAIFNQLVVRIIRNSQYVPKLFHCTLHLRLNSTHHLILSKHHTSISLRVQRGHERFCRPCLEASAEAYPYSPRCAHIHHIIGEQTEYYPSDNIATLIEISNRLTPTHEPHFAFTDSENHLENLCPSVLAVVQHHLNFLADCWFPGLKLNLLTYVEDTPVTLDQRWYHTVLCTGTAPPSVCVWFSQ